MKNPAIDEITKDDIEIIINSNHYKKHDDLTIDPVDHPNMNEAWDQIYGQVPEGFEDTVCDSGTDSDDGKEDYIWAVFRRE